MRNADIRKIRRKAHRWVSCFGISLCALLLVLFSFSIRSEYGYERRTVAIGFTSGALFVDVDPSSVLSGWFYINNREPIVWRPGVARFQGTVVVYIPLWLPFLLIAVPSVSALGRTPRPPPGHCEKCGYNLTGLVESRCPECASAFGAAVSGSVIVPLRSGESRIYKMPWIVPLFGMVPLLFLLYVFLSEGGVVPWVFVPRKDPILQEPGGGIVVGLFLGASAFGMALGRIRVILSASGLNCRGLLRTVSIPWTDVDCIRHTERKLEFWVLARGRCVHMFNLPGEEGELLEGVVACTRLHAPGALVLKGRPDFNLLWRRKGK